MSRFTTTMTPDYFEAKYAADPDPWRFAASPYERDKYQATLAALPRPHYERGLEIGCSIGVLTRQLASRCASLLGVDAAETALVSARDRCADLAHVSFTLSFVPGDWPDGRFDLILLSEVLYFLEQQDVEKLARRVVGSIEPGGSIVLVHWLGETNYPLSGDEATRIFLAEAAGFTTVLRRSRTERYRLDVLAAGCGLEGAG